MDEDNTTNTTPKQPQGFGIGGNLLGELKNKQKQTGRYISSSGNSGHSVDNQNVINDPSLRSAEPTPPPLPARDSENEIAVETETSNPDPPPSHQIEGAIPLPVVPQQGAVGTLHHHSSNEQPRSRPPSISKGDTGLMAALARRRKIADGESPPIIQDTPAPSSVPPKSETPQKPEKRFVPPHPIAATSIAATTLNAPSKSAKAPPPIPAKPPAIPAKPSIARKPSNSAIAAAKFKKQAIDKRKDDMKDATPVVVAATTAAIAASQNVAPTQPVEPAKPKYAAPITNPTPVVPASQPIPVVPAPQSSTQQAKHLQTSPVRLERKSPFSFAIDDDVPEVKHEESAPVEKPKKPRGGDPTRDLNTVDWDTYFTTEGEPYYVNTVTGETTWDKPMELLTAAEMSALSGEFIWVKHDDYAWIPAKVIEKTASHCLVQEVGQGIPNEALNMNRKVDSKSIGPAIPSPQVLTNLTNDLVQLDQVDEPSIIDLLRRRYMKGKIYTSVGDILVAVNPFKSTNLFTPAIMHSYNGADKVAMELPPHPYAIINAAYHDMLEYKKDQSLLISGESGAGKTVTVKVCLEFLSEVAGSDDNNIEQKILAANPILEAFGNAKTLRNDNSSRFGKFMEIHFNLNGGKDAQNIVGCYTVNYLLEKSRVIARFPGERNFHIFYYMLSQFPESQRKELLLDCPSETFKYLSADGSACADPEQHNDEEECSKMNRAMESMGFKDDERDFIFKCAAAVLHLGNVNFEEHGDTGSTISSPDSIKAVENFAQLVQVDKSALIDALTKHVSMQRDGLLTRPFTPEKAVDARNALARHLYGKLFNWLVIRINSAMSFENADTVETNFIGMLDIFGFEIFETNSFEQLCINFANEKLQQMFNHHTFCLEEETYRSEQVEFDTIEFYDSQPLLDFLGFPASNTAKIHDGVFQLLDEQTAIGSGTDAKFLQAVVSRHRDKKKLFSDRCRSRTAFKIFHYAGAVEYEVVDFVAKNADKLYENISDCMLNSKNALVKFIFEDSEAMNPRASMAANRMSVVSNRSSRSGSNTRRSKRSQASLFMSQLHELEEKTNGTYPRYIRTIKPNPHKVPDLFVSPMCLQQLRFAGVFEAVSIRKRGYPFRHTHEHFVSTFRPLVPSAVTHSELVNAKQMNSYQACAQKVLDAIIAGPVPQAASCKMGRTMVLYRATEHRSLEIKRLLVVNKAAAQIQKMMRGVYVRMNIPKLKAGRQVLQAAIQARDTEKLNDAIAETSILFFKIKEVYDAEVVREAIRQESAMAPRISKILTMDMTLDSTFESMRVICEDIERFQKRDPLAFASSNEAILIMNKFTLIRGQRHVKKKLRQILEKVPLVSLSVSLAALETGLSNAEEVRTAGDGDTTCFKDELANATEKKARLQSEQELLTNAITYGNTLTITGEKGRLDVQALTGSLNEFENSLDELSKHQVESADGKNAVALLTATFTLRNAVVIALQSAEHADDPEWREVESLLRDISGAATNANEEALFHVSNDELSLISAEIAFRSAVDDVVDKLNAGIAEVDDEQISVALDQAIALDLFAHPDPKIVAVATEAQTLLPRVQAARSSLHNAISQVNEQLLAEALVLQTQCGYGAQPGRAGYQVVQQAQTLLAWVRTLTQQAQIAVEVLYDDPTENIVNGCHEINLQIPELVVLEEFLGLTKDVKLYRQREAAVKIGNYRRAVRLSIEEKDLIFLRPESRENYNLQHFPKLKTPEEFAKRLGIKWGRYKETMLQHYDPHFGGKIHTALTRIECATDEETKRVQKLATHMFKDIYGVMGDKMYENVGGMAQELLQTGLECQEIRDEIYCQLMKQLTNNSKPDSVSKGWNLMAMVLFTFPPSTQLANYLESFLRNNNQDGCLLKLHQCLLGGPLTRAPTIEEVERVRVPGSVNFWLPGGRTQIQLTEEMWGGTEVVDQQVVDWKASKYQPGIERQPSLSEMSASGALQADLAQQRSQVPISATAAGAPPPPVRQASAYGGQAPPPPARQASAYGGQAPPPPARQASAYGGQAPPPPTRQGSANSGQAPPPPARQASAYGGQAPPPPTRQASAYGGQAPPPPTRQGSANSGQAPPPPVRQASAYGGQTPPPPARQGSANSGQVPPPPTRQGSAYSGQVPPPPPRQASAYNGETPPPLPEREESLYNGQVPPPPPRRNSGSTML